MGSLQTPEAKTPTGTRQFLQTAVVVVVFLSLAPRGNNDPGLANQLQKVTKKVRSMLCWKRLFSSSIFSV